MWLTIGIIFVIVWGAIIWEIKNAPIMPDDYGIEEKEKTNEKNN